MTKRKEPPEDAEAFFARLREQSKERVISYSLPGLLPQGYSLSIWKELNTVQLLGPDGLLAEQQFTVSEMCVLIPILNSYPHFCPYDELLAHFSSGSDIDEQDRAQARQQLEQGWDKAIRPVRNVLSRVRLKLHTFGLDVMSILETGYILMQSRKR